MNNAVPEKESSNTPIAFEREWVLGLGSIIVLAALSLVSIWFITAPVINAAINNQPFSDELALNKVLLVDLIILLIWGFLCAGPIAQLYTKFTNEGIEQPSFPKTKIILWRDVQEIRNITTANIEIVGFDKKISINPNLFKNHHQLISEIRSRIPESSFPSETQIENEVNRIKRNDYIRSAIGSFLFGVIAFVIGKNVIAIILGLVGIAYGLYEIRKLIKINRG